MNGILPSPVTERTTPSALIDLAQKGALDLNSDGCTKVKGIPLARIADSPCACHTAVPMFCSRASVPTRLWVRPQVPGRSTDKTHLDRRIRLRLLAVFPFGSSFSRLAVG